MEPLPFANLLGVEIVNATPEEVIARLEVRPELCTPIHRGKRTMMRQTRVTTELGRRAAFATQTQMVLPPVSTS